MRQWIRTQFRLRQNCKVYFRMNEISKAYKDMITVFEVGTHFWPLIFTVKQADHQAKV